MIYLILFSVCLCDAIYINPNCYSFCSLIALMSKTQFVPLTYLLNILLLIPAINSHMYYFFVIYLLQVFTILFDKYKSKLLFLTYHIYIFFIYIIINFETIFQYPNFNYLYLLKICYHIFLPHICLRIVVSNIYCVVFLFAFLRIVYPMLPVSLDCQFLIAPFGIL